MSEKEKLVSIIKSTLGSEHKYQMFIEKYTFYNSRRNKLLKASMLCNNVNPDLVVMIQAYKIIKNVKGKENIENIDVVSIQSSLNKNTKPPAIQKKNIKSQNKTEEISIDDISLGSELSIIHKLIYNLKKGIGLSYYSEEDGRKKANELLYKKVQNPYDRTSSTLLIDVLLNSAMDANAIRNVFHSYGIEYAKDGIDLTGNSTLEYMLYHGKKYNYHVDGENITTDTTKIFNEAVVPDELPIIPNTHLEHIRNLVSSSNEGYNSFFGQAAEFSIKRQLETMGYEAILPTDRNVMAVDIYVNKKFFDDYGMTYVEHPSKLGFGMVQIKTTSMINPTNNYTSNTMEHFVKYPDIPVLSSSKIANSLYEKYPEGQILGFDKIGLNELSAETEVYKQLEAVKSIHGDSLIKELKLPTGANISNSDLDAIKDSSLLFGDTGLNSIPMLGIALSATFATYSNYRRIKNKEITIDQGIKNIGMSTAKTAVVGTISVAATQVLLNNTFNATAGAEIMEGAETLFSGDFSLDGLEEMGEAAIIIAALASIGYGAKKVWEFFAGNPMDEYHRLLQEREKLEQQMATLIKSNRINIDTTSGIKRVLEIKKEMIGIDNMIDDNTKSYTFNISGIQSLKYYIFEQKKNALLQENMMHDVSHNLYHALNRMSMLNKLKKKTIDDKNIIISEIKNIYKDAGKDYSKKIEKLLKKAKIKKTEEAVAYIKMLLTNEINYITSFFETIYKKDKKLQPIYLASQQYINHQKKIIKEYKKLKDQGHIKN